jgi:hypothetical protein
MAEERFYRRYAALLERCLSHLHAGSGSGEKEHVQ